MVATILKQELGPAPAGKDRFPKRLRAEIWNAVEYTPPAGLRCLDGYGVTHLDGDAADGLVAQAASHGGVTNLDMLMARCSRQRRRARSAS